MGLEGVFFGKEGPDGKAIDDEHAAFILGLLLHAGERAKRYEAPTDTPGSTSGPAVPLTAEVVENVYDEIQRVRPEPPAIPNTANIFHAAQIERSEVSQLAQGNTAEITPRANDHIRETIRHSQDSLRAAGVETVTLYRGGVAGEDPFHRSSGDPLRVRMVDRQRPSKGSGITSWTTNPAKARSYAMTGMVVYRAEVPVENIVSYDVIGLASTASTSQTRPLTGAEVLVASDPSIVQAMLDSAPPPPKGMDVLDLIGVTRVTPATMEGNGTAGPAPAV